jgi:hypothetical protein
VKEGQSDRGHRAPDEASRGGTLSSRRNESFPFDARDPAFRDKLAVFLPYVSKMVSEIRITY